ncbi:AEC family transporter [Azomonas macrocytogenes]|uniref:AEC family transporter n=1 Tax=Azomonas macrocytogenes TaxID=69962 RepID=A0A839T268_AZOMA|nr:AEC family transporter [Azomonas macrocytogenes]MBB3102045.1 hypothetical protein [Azomonas macrocytogenes]
MFALLHETLTITAPVFCMLLVGVLLRRIGLIDEVFIYSASSLVFNATMPTLLFLGIVEMDPDVPIHPGVLVYLCLASVLGFLFAWGWALRHCPRADRGVYVQGAFRGNNGTVGLALAASLYGSYGLSLGSVMAGAVILFYNGLSSIVLAVYSPTAKTDAWSLCKTILRNPLIIGVLLASPFAWFDIRLPTWLLTSGHYFAQMTMPLALICIGASLSLSSLRRSSELAFSASLMKMVWLPLVSTLGAWLLGFRGADLGVLFLYFASPTASVSFIMARAVNGNHELAAAIVAITTVAAVLTTNIGLFVLQWAGWI